MKTIFQKFNECLFNLDDITINPSFDKVLHKFNFFLIDSTIKNNQFLLDLESKNNFIIIDDNLPKKDYFIICFDYNLIIVEQSNHKFLQNLFEILQNSIIYCLKNKNILQKNFPTINFNFSDKDQDHFFLFEIQSFCKEIKIKHKIFQEFWEMIQQSISGFLIIKSYVKILSKSRLFDDIEKVQFDSKLTEIQFKSEDLIQLRDIGYSNSAVILYYYIEKEQLIALKTSIDDESLILREQNNYLKCEHLFLLKYYGYIMKNNKKSILIEFIYGNTLNKIESIKLNTKEKIEIIFELILIVKYIHMNGLIYRDLRPENIMIDHNKTVVLIDLDRLIENSNDNSIYTTKNFSHEYIAPEIVCQNYSYPVDIYSLGLTIYFIVSEKNPNIESRNTIELLNEFTNEFKYLKDIFERSIQINPDKRPTIDEIYNKFEQKYILNNDMNYEIRKSLINIYENNFLYENKGNNKSSELFYQLGLNHNKNFPNLSIKYFDISAKQNHLKSGKISLNLCLQDNKYDELLIKQQDPSKLNYYASILLINKKDFKRSITFFQAAASKGYLIAQLNLGQIFYKENEVKDINKSIYYFKLAADKNSSKAQFYLGLIYYENVFDINKSIYYFKLSSDQNNPDAQLFLGQIYYENKFVSKDIDKSIYYYTLAAKNNNIVAQCNLGLFYYEGKEIKKDLNKSFYYFSLTANQNNSKLHGNLESQHYLKSLYYLGLICLNPKNIYYNIKESIKYFTISANQNHVESQFCLGEIYLKDSYIYYDINKAIHYLQLAANNNHLKSIFELACIYFRGFQIKKDLNKAIHYFTIAANLNHSPSQCCLGLIYFDKKSIYFNMKQAIKYFTLSANQNHSYSQYLLGEYYYNEKDNHKCIFYLTKSAKNLIFAQYRLGLIYYEGKITIRDINRSIYYLKLASKQNFSLASCLLGKIFYYGYYIKPNINKAIKYYKLSANQNNSEAQCILGLLYYKGDNVKQDINKGLFYLQLSSKQNNSYSQFYLGYIYYFNQDFEKSIYYLLLSAKQNNSYAFLYLGNIYLNYYHDYNKSIQYFLLASKEKSNCMAQYAIGCFYFKGNDYFDRDISKAIHYFKEASSLNDVYSKNNLGIIYKYGDGVIQNIKWSIEYFNEAIKIDNNSVSLYNLAHLYFFEEFVPFDLDKSIGLLIKSAKNNYYSIQLLSLALVLKCEHVSISNIENEIKKVDQKSSDTMSMNVLDIIQYRNLSNSSCYNALYDDLKKIDLVYDSNYNYIEYKTNEKIIKKDKKQRNVNQMFYEGFGEEAIL